MKSNWKEYTVQELIDLGMLEEPLDGNHGSIHPKASDYVDSGVPFIMANNIINGVVDLDGCAFITEEQANTLRKGFAKPGDVLLTHKATIGRTAIVPDKYETIILTPQVTYYRTIKGIDNRYLKYYFDSPFFQETLTNWAGSGSTRAYLGILAQHKLPIILPPYDEQIKIAGLLDLLDKKILVNTEINENLEQQAASCFYHQFIVNTSPSWRAGTISDLGTVVGGGTPSKAKAEYYTDNGIAWITPKDLSTDKSKFIAHGTNDITELGLRNSSATIMPAGTVLFSSRAPIGYIAIADGEVSTNQGFKSIIPFNNVGTAFVYFFLKNALPTIENMASGSTFKEISGSAMRTVPALIPDNDSLHEFSIFCEPLFKQQRMLEAENRSLAALRDALLPHLMSGELDVSNLNI